MERKRNGTRFQRSGCKRSTRTASRTTVKKCRTAKNGKHSDKVLHEIQLRWKGGSIRGPWTARLYATSGCYEGRARDNESLYRIWCIIKCNRKAFIWWRASSRTQFKPQCTAHYPTFQDAIGSGYLQHRKGIFENSPLAKGLQYTSFAVVRDNTHGWK